MHAAMKHGYTKESKLFAASDTCQACLRKYHTRARVIVHLQMNPSCMETYRSCFVPMPDEQVDALQQNDYEINQQLKRHGWKPTKALLPVVRLPGPALPQSGSAAASKMQEAWAQRGQQSDRASGMQGHCVSVLEGEKEGSEEQLLVRDSSGGSIDGYAGCAADRGPAFHLAQINMRCYFFLHFFSGYRREEDLQCKIETTWTGGSSMTYCLSIDLCLLKEKSDLTSASTAAFWLEKARDGYIVGAGGARPVRRVVQPGSNQEGPPL